MHLYIDHQLINEPIDAIIRDTARYCANHPGTRVIVRATADRTATELVEQLRAYEIDADTTTGLAIAHDYALSDAIESLGFEIQEGALA